MDDAYGKGGDLDLRADRLNDFDRRSNAVAGQMEMLKA